MYTLQQQVLLPVRNFLITVFDSGTKRHRETDSASITTFGEREFQITLPLLSNHQNEWARWVAQHSLNTFKNLESIIRIRLLPTFDIQVGDIVYLNVPRDEIRRVGLVIRVLYSSNREQTDVEIRTITI